MKNKKQKKDKRKKQKKQKHRQQDDNSSESSGDEMEWVEASSASSATKTDSPSPDPVRLLTASKDPAPQQKEDDWLESPFLTATTSQADIRRDREAEREKEKAKEKGILDNPGQTVRELNPFWRDGGTGLPDAPTDTRRQTAPVVRRVGRGVDGGVSWLKKAYQRAVEQAKDSGQSVEAVVAERWGSMAEYERELDQAKAACRGRGHLRSPGPRGPSGPPPPGWRKRRDEDDDREMRRDRSREGDKHYQSDRYDRGRDDRGGGERDDRSDSRWKYRTTDSESRRNLPQQGFMKPGERDRDGERQRDTYSKFRRPGDDDSNSSRDRSGSSYHDRGSSSRERRRDDDLPSWRKTGFKKPGEDDYSSSGTRSSSSSRAVPPPSSSSSSGGWRKAGFKKPGDGGAEASSGARSSSSADASSTSSLSGGWRKSGSAKPGEDEKSSKRPRSSRERSPQQPSASKRESSPHRSRRRDDSDSDSDDVRSSASSSPDAKESEKEAKQEQVKERSPSPVKILSDTEMNQLGAKLIKAEIMGNETVVQKLKAQIEASRRARIAHKTKLLEAKGGEGAKGSEGAQKRGRGEKDKEKEEVILTRTDHSGQSWPLAEQTAPSEGGKKKRKKNIVTHDKGGERERYFADDDDIDLETMVRREKMGSGEDPNRLINKVASKKLMLMDSEFNTLDEMFVSSAAKGESRARIEERERAKAIADHRRTVASLSKCPFCLESGEMKKHLIVALGLKVYLCVPQTRCISEGHCYIIPMEHAVASTALDEDVWAEIQIFRKGLTRMFEDHEMDAIFLETCMNPKKQRHMCIECIAVPRELGEMGPIYFKKAIQESESEWTQNKKLVDTRKKGIRSSVPRGFPYFSVDFGLDGGFAHVIEDELVFPHYFGKEVIGGMLDVEPRLWRHPPKENFEDQSKRVLQLSQWWKPFDWTEKIDREKS